MHLEDLIATMKNNLESATELPYQKLQEHAKKHGSKSPYYDAISSINAFEKDLIDAPTNINPPKSIKDVMTNKEGRVSDIAFLKDGTPVHFSYGNDKKGGKHIVKKHPTALTNDIAEKIKNKEYKITPRGTLKVNLGNGDFVYIGNREFGKGDVLTAYKKDGRKGLSIDSDPTYVPKVSSDRASTTGNMITQNGDNAPINFNDLAT